MTRGLGKPIRVVLRWQMMATAAMTLVAGPLAGVHGMISAALGGLVSIAAGLAFAVVASMHKGEAAGSILVAALRAETVKVLVIVLLLWLVLATYRDVVILGFIGSFAACIVIFTMAFFVSDQN